MDKIKKLKQRKKWDRKYRKKSKKEIKEYYEKNKERWQKYYRDNRERIIENGKKYKNQPKSQYKKLKYDADKRKIEFGLTFKEFKTFLQKPCYYCGGKVKTTGLDRVDNSKGYIFDNLVSCCKKCNYGKGQISKEEFINHCKKVANKFK